MLTLPRWPGSAPLFVQIVSLLVFSLITAQVVNVAVVLGSPPPAPELYAVTEVARILGQPGTSEGDARLVATVGKPPEGAVQYALGSRSEMIRMALAEQLRVAPERVRVLLHSDPGRGPFGIVPFRAELRSPRPTWHRINDTIFVGHFIAAELQDDGRWRIVQPRHDYMLMAWQQQTLWWFLVSTLIVTLPAYLFARTLAAPFRAFATAAEQLGRDPRAPPLVLRGPAEIGNAARAFNGMQDRLRRYIEDRTAMIGAIAHDLRTPLTRLAFRLESVPPDLREKASADIAEMNAMISATLAFVRDEARPSVFEPVDLRGLLANIARNMVDSGAVVAVVTCEPVVLRGNPAALRSAFSNLVVNAVKYGSTARIAVRVTPDSAVIDIDDDGPGVPQGELEQVFEPFYRLERSRSRGTGGIGLGLAIVRTIVHAHGGVVRLSNRSGGGLRATVSLPV